MGSENLLLSRATQNQTDKNLLSCPYLEMSPWYVKPCMMTLGNTTNACGIKISYKDLAKELPGLHVDRKAVWLLLEKVITMGWSGG